MNPKILIISGPTASGKKKIALDAAERFDGEIISADSRKVYRYLDIGTAKPSATALKRIPHYLIDIVDPDEPFNCGEWVIRASKTARDIINRGKLPVISGGTGFYIKAFMYGLSEGISADSEVRENLKREFDEIGAPAMHAQLSKIDPQRAAEIHENDSFRIMRALEVYYSTGRTFFEFRAEPIIKGGEYDYFHIGVEKERDELYRCIDNRVDSMVEQGLIDELKRILDMGYSRDLTAFDTVGYKEWFPYLDGASAFEVCLEKMKADTRHYAKRQMTWFRAMDNVKRIDPDEPGAVDSIFGDLKRWLDRKVSS
ncbi:tRNA (adenosine(37)-N6)-dimethylallyltransferase MiaA [Candidatus Latescibacterota bacterium]